MEEIIQELKSGIQDRQEWIGKARAQYCYLITKQGTNPDVLALIQREIEKREQWCRRNAVVLKKLFMKRDLLLK